MELESSGVVQISVDEMLVRSAGRLGIDYDPADHITLLAPIVETARAQVGQHLSARRARARPSS